MLVQSRIVQKAVGMLFAKGTRMTRLTDVSRATPVVAALMSLQKTASHTKLDPRLLELVRMRASQMNGCAACLSMHTRDALSHGERVDRLSVVSAWRESDWFDERERAALLWTESLTDLAGHHVPDAVAEEMRGVFSEEELVQLTLNIIAINGWNRMNAAFGTRPQSFDI